ncbi:MAG: HPF/RaiA family ribosome-associated protein [Actinobacteria bacterium]|nr:HPF/RaiA family ribosome-associated protein [Actinomycetota bacterium]
MKILIHTRHADLAEDFKSIAQEKLSSMDRFSVVIDRVEVEVLHEANPQQGKHAHSVVLTSHGSGPLLRAEAAEFNDLAAFDSAIKAFASALKSMIVKLYER